MFRIPEIIVEDKNLSKLLRAVSGLVLNMGTPQPVRETSGGDGTVPSQVLEVLRRTRKSGDQVRGADIAAAISELGVNPGAKGYCVKRFLESKALMKTKKRGFFTLVGRGVK